VQLVDAKAGIGFELELGSPEVEDEPPPVDTSGKQRREKFIFILRKEILL
jgi:hypothetical protein